MKLLLTFAVIITIAKAYPPTTETYGGNGYHAQGNQQSQGFSRGHVDPATEARRLADKNAQITKYQSENSGHQYKYAYETSNGISAQEMGIVSDGTQAHGGYSYTGDNGEQFAVAYTADKNGFRPSGSHLPTPQPLPAEIAKSLEQNAADEARGIFDNGSYRRHEQSRDSHASQYPHESHATQYPHESHAAQYPHESHATQNPHESHVNQYSYGSHVTQNPHDSHVSQYSHGNHVAQHPHESHVTQQYGAFEALKVDAHPQVHGAHKGSGFGYHKY